MEEASPNKVELVVRTIAQTAVDNEKYFGDLDAVVGDGDFGYSMARGFEIVLADWDSFDRTDIGTFLKKIAVVITSRVGGTSGPLWGTAFLRAGAVAGDKTELTSDDAIAMLRAAIEGIKKRGNSDLGDKTLLDALEPAVDELEKALGEGDDAAAAIRRAATTAREQAEATKEMLAKRGRAVVHGRAQHRDAGRGGDRRRGHVRTGRRRMGGRRVRRRTRMKKFVNDPKEFVPEMLKGIALANPDTLKYVPEYNLIMRTDAPSDAKVSIVQGSGSGHEPAHVMIVGKGMLDAACPGDVFAAPPMDYVLETTKLLNSKKGVLHLINNYTGDRMAFEMGAEMAEAEGITDRDRDRRRRRRREGLHVDGRTPRRRRQLLRHQGDRRGVGEGAELEDLVALGERVNSVTRTMGMALTSCTPPAKGSPLFELGDDEMEMGVGIHGEPGRRREKLADANAIVDELVEATASDLPVQQGRQRRADDQRARRHADQRAVPAVRPGARSARRRAGSTSDAATSASTARRSTWRAAR